jgi:hypothetical protein
MIKCILCGKDLKYYDGMLGYESYQCEHCHWDINSLLDNGAEAIEAMQNIISAINHNIDDDGNIKQQYIADEMDHIINVLDKIKEE